MPITDVLRAHGIAISMDGRGRALDNIFVERLWRSVKHEDVYLKGYATLPELLLGLTEYFVFYNTERMHQSLDYRAPDEVYRTASGGGASIVDKFTARKENRQEKTESKTGAAPCRSSSRKQISQRSILIISPLDFSIGCPTVNIRTSTSV